MKTGKIRIILSLLIIAAFIFSVGVMGVSALGEAHNLYTSFSTAGTSGKYQAFMIDFYTDSENALATYWALANYSLDTSATIKKLHYIGLTSPSGYAGMQCRYSDTDRVGIMSVWEYTYTDITTMKTVTLNAERIFPTGTDGFDNEGSGVKCIKNYEWSDNNWYRMLLLSWQDEETGNTFIGNFYYDYANEKWTLFCYYNTHLVDSYFKGAIGQFQECFMQSRAEILRSFRYKNFYVLDIEKEEWLSVPNITVTSDSYEDKVGNVTCGIADDRSYVTGTADGASSEAYKKLNQSYILNQPEKPTYGVPSIETLKVNENAANTVVTWSAGDKSTPQLSYKLEIIDEEGKTIYTKSQSRPEVTSLKLDPITADEYKCTLTVTDVFGAEVTKEFKTAGYTETVPTPTPTTTPSTTPEETAAPTTTPDVTATETPSETVTPSDTATTPSNTAEPTTTPSETAENKTDNTVIIIIIAAVVAVVAIAAIVILGKKKH